MTELKINGNTVRQNGVAEKYMKVAQRLSESDLGDVCVWSE